MKLLRIKSLELSWFRGAAEKTELDLKGKSIVVYGENGSGKSSFVDAIEYILQKGKVEHLRGEYADRSGQRNCVRNTATPDDVDAKSVINFVGGGYVSVNIPKEGSIGYNSSHDDMLEDFQKWKKMSHILRQFEVAEFITQSKGQKYTALTPLIGLKDYEDTHGNFEKLEKQIREISELNVLKSRYQGIKDELLKKTGLLDKDKLIQEMRQRGEKYGIVYEELSRTSQNACEVIQKRIEEIEPNILRINTIRNISKTLLPKSLEEYHKAVHESAEELNHLTEQRLRVLEQAQTYLETDIQDEIIICPVCGSLINKAELNEHIQTELDSLEKIREISDSLQKTKKDIIRNVDELKSINREISFQEWLEGPENSKIKNQVDILNSTTLPNENTKWEEATTNTIEESVTRLLELLTPFVKEESPSTKELQLDYNFFETAPRVSKYQNLERKISTIEILEKAIQRIQENIRTRIVEITEETLGNITKDVQHLWEILHEDEPIEEIKLIKSEGFDTGIDITLKFYGTEQQSPILHLSEGHSNSLGLCVFLALAKQEPVDHPLILDDIVSSFDRDHRAFIVDILNTELSDRQVLLFTHDAEWFRELNRRLDSSQWEFFSLKKWELPGLGINVERSRFTFDEARIFLPDNPKAAATAVRTIMDWELGRISQRLQVPFPYIDGQKNQQRGPVLHMEGIIARSKEKFKEKNGKSWKIYETPHACWQETHGLLVEWANRSSHRGTLTVREARRMISKCEESLEYFKCSDCGKAIWMLDKGTDYKRCHCGKLRWNL